MPTTRKPTTRRETPVQARKSALESDYTPFYAVAGLTDVFAETVRKTMLERQQRAAELQAKRIEQTRANAEEIRKFVATLPEQLKALPETTRARLTELQKQAADLRAQANGTYTELAGRGKRAVDDLSGKAQGRAEEVLHDVADRVDPAFERIEETVIVARQTVTGRTATETVTPRSAAKSAASREAAEAKAAADKAGEAKVAAVRKTSNAKVAEVKKAAAEAEATRKAEVRKQAAKKAAATRAAKKAAATESLAAEESVPAEVAEVASEKAADEKSE